MATESSTPHLKTILILGGSYGGVSTAHYILKHAFTKLSEPESYQVVMVSPTPDAWCRPAAPRAMISDAMFDQKKLFVNVEKSFENYPKGQFSFISGTAIALDYNDRNVTIKLPSQQTQKISYYALVIATGANTPSPLMGYNLDEDHMKASWESIRKVLPTAKKIIIGGGGPTAVETSGELGEYLNGAPGWFSSKLANPKVSITLVTSSSKLLPVLSEKFSIAAEKCLAKVGVEIIKNTRITSVTPDGAGTTDPAARATVTLADGRTLDGDLYIPAFGQNPNTSFMPGELLAADGRVNTNPATLRVDKAGPRVYAIGDAANYSRAAIHHITNAIPILGANIKKDLLQAAGEDRKFEEDMRTTHLVPMGKSMAVGSIMGWQVPYLMVWLLKGRDYWLWTTPDLWSGKQWNKET